MKIRLKSMAPWNEVTLNDGFVVSKSWKDDDGSHNVKPIAAYVEYEDIKLVVDSLLTKIELISIAKNLFIDTAGLTKAQLIEAINAVN